MSIHSDRELYQLIEQHLTQSPDPLTCVEIMDIPDVRKAALEEFGGDVQHAINKVSDALGFMWRRKAIDRYPAAGNRNKARFAYKITPRKVATPSPISFPKEKAEMKITERDGKVTIELNTVTITITTR